MRKSEGRLRGRGGDGRMQWLEVLATGSLERLRADKVGQLSARWKSGGEKEL